jgi:hypothetical protein
MPTHTQKGMCLQGSICADPEDIVKMQADGNKREIELLAIKPLSKLNVVIMPLGHNIMLIPAKGLRLNHTEIVLWDVSRFRLKTL